MNTRAFLALSLLITSATFGVDLPTVPDKPVSKKKELLFSDNFERAALGKAWGKVVPTFAIENGTLKGTQFRFDTPAADGKPAVVGHQAVIGTDIPTRDSVIEMKFRFAGALSVTAEFDDRNFTGAHYGHICMVRVTPKSVILSDQKEGSMRNDIYEMSKDPARKDERNKFLAGRSVTFPVKLEDDQWHHLVLETVGDSMRATIDGKPAGFLKSPGIAHPTKSKVEFGCMGKAGFFDDIKIWNAEPAKP